MRTPCLGLPGKPCPAYATLHGRCTSCRSAWHAARNGRPSRAIYKGGWAAYSRKVRAEVGHCQVRGPLCTGGPDSLDHNTGLVACLGCHRSEANGGVRKVQRSRDAYTRRQHAARDIPVSQ